MVDISRSPTLPRALRRCFTNGRSESSSQPRIASAGGAGIHRDLQCNGSITHVSDAAPAASDHNSQPSQSSASAAGAAALSTVVVAAAAVVTGKELTGSGTVRGLLAPHIMEEVAEGRATTPGVAVAPSTGVEHELGIIVQSSAVASELSLEPTGWPRCQAPLTGPQQRSCSDAPVDVTPTGGCVSDDVTAADANGGDGCGNWKVVAAAAVAEQPDEAVRLLDVLRAENAQLRSRLTATADQLADREDALARMSAEIADLDESRTLYRRQLSAHLASAMLLPDLEVSNMKHPGDRVDELPENDNETPGIAVASATAADGGSVGGVGTDGAGAWGVTAATEPRQLLVQRTTDSPYKYDCDSELLGRGAVPQAGGHPLLMQCLLPVSYNSFQASDDSGQRRQRLPSPGLDGPHSDLTAAPSLLQLLLPLSLQLAPFWESPMSAVYSALNLQTEPAPPPVPGPRPAASPIPSSKAYTSAFSLPGGASAAAAAAAAADTPLRWSPTAAAAAAVVPLPSSAASMSTPSPYRPVSVLDSCPKPLSVRDVTSYCGMVDAATWGQATANVGDPGHTPAGRAWTQRVTSSPGFACPESARGRAPLPSEDSCVSTMSYSSYSTLFTPGCELSSLRSSLELPSSPAVSLDASGTVPLSEDPLHQYHHTPAGGSSAECSGLWHLSPPPPLSGQHQAQEEPAKSQHAVVVNGSNSCRQYYSWRRRPTGAARGPRRALFPGAPNGGEEIAVKEEGAWFPLSNSALLLRSSSAATAPADLVELLSVSFA